MFMSSDNDQELEPIDVKALMAEYAEMSFADLVLEVKDLKDALEREKTAHSYDERLLRKAEEELNTLRGRIAASTIGKPVLPCCQAARSDSDCRQLIFRVQL